ncbi:hypothetical protein BaRGS_00008131, partial [Batillaria attramentaria]
SPHRLESGLWDCSVPYYASFKQHVHCNLEVECDGGEDEGEHCPFSSPACGGGVALPASEAESGRSLPRDEQVAHRGSSSVAMFVCDNKKQNVPYTLVCDFREDCGDGSDESFCVRKSECPTGFSCQNKQCIDEDKKCDNEYDCLDATDEKGIECLSAVYLISRVPPLKPVPPPAIFYNDKVAGPPGRTHPNLVRMDLSRTELEILDTSVLRNVPHIQHLNVSSSAISTIADTGFSSIPLLAELDLRGNTIVRFPTPLYQGLQNLKTVLSDSYKIC